MPGISKNLIKLRSLIYQKTLHNLWYLKVSSYFLIPSYCVCVFVCFKKYECFNLNLFCG